MDDANTPRRVVAYIGAHQDDWQLFMSPQAYADLIADNTCVVFIYTTTGDAGDRRWGRGRSAGALSSIQFATRRRIEPVAPERVTVNGHPIACCSIASTRSYFLDLPDGNMDGSGFPTTGSQSLQLLRQGAIPGIDAIADDAAFQTRYASWDDLAATIRALLGQEAAAADGEVWVHILDPLVSRHSDHAYTGQLVEEAIASDARYRLACYDEYAIPDRAPNVHGVDLALKAGLYLFYAQTAFEHSGQVAQFDDWHLSFLPRQYRTR